VIALSPKEAIGSSLLLRFLYGMSFCSTRVGSPFIPLRFPVEDDDLGVDRLRIEKPRSLADDTL
jgi:hypothetical protein